MIHISIQFAYTIVVSVLIMNVNADDKQIIKEFCDNPIVRAALPVISGDNAKEFKVYIFSDKHFFELDVNEKVLSNPRRISAHWDYKNKKYFENGIDATFTMTFESSDHNDTRRSDDDHTHQTETIEYFIKGEEYFIFESNGLIKTLISNGFTNSTVWNTNPNIKFPVKVSAALLLVPYSHHRIKSLHEHNNSVLFINGEKADAYGPFTKSGPEKPINSIFACVNKTTSEMQFLNLKRIYDSYCEIKNDFIPIDKFMEVTAMVPKFGTSTVILFANDEHCTVIYHRQKLESGKWIPRNVKCNKEKNMKLFENTSECKKESRSPWINILIIFILVIIALLFIAIPAGIIIFLKYHKFREYDSNL